jgi:VanZ family protein
MLWLSHLPRPLRVVLFLSAVAVILWLSLAPGNAIPQVNLWDKAKHAIAYAALTAGGLALFPKHVRALVAGVFVMGLAIEGLQAVMGFGRSGDWRDVVGNVVGIALALGAWRQLRPWRSAP